MIIDKTVVDYRQPNGQVGKKLLVSYVNKEGTVSFLQYPIQPQDMFCWKTCTAAKADPEFYEFDYEKNDYKKDENGNMIKRRWMSYDDKYVARFPVKELPEYRLTELLCSFGDRIKEIYEMYPINPLFYDIETEVKDSVPDPNVADVQINTIAGVTFPKAILWSRKPLTEEEMDWIREKVRTHSQVHATDPTKRDYTSKYEVEFRIFDNEHDMLADFVDYCVPIACVCGYNSFGFDNPLLRNRCLKNAVDFDKISPVHKCFRLNFTPRAGGHKVDVMLPQHKAWGDLLITLRQFYVGPALENMTLDFISKTFLSFQKVAHKWTYAEGFDTDRADYCYYNIIDTINTELIAKETGLLNVWFMLSSILRVNLYDTYSTIRPVECVMQNFIYKDFKVIPSDKKKVPETQEEYSGAFVWPSRPQIARMVGGLDFASLYPSIIREFNMSPETYKGRANDKDDRSDKDLIYTASGVLYERNRSGIIPNILTYYFAQRKQAKNDMKQADTEHQYYSDILEKRLSAAKIENN